jgi:hypothetical protein
MPTCKSILLYPSISLHSIANYSTSDLIIMLEGILMVHQALDATEQFVQCTYVVLRLDCENSASAVDQCLY